jgi:hypothetical protein
MLIGSQVWHGKAHTWEKVPKWAAKLDWRDIELIIQVDQEMEGDFGRTTIPDEGYSAS